MSGSPDYVSDDEVLYRSVKENDVVRNENGQILRVTSQAFADMRREVSLDRAKFRTPEECRFRPSDTVVSLTAGDIRAIQNVIHNQQQYQIDVRPDPVIGSPDLPDNPAHSVVVGSPNLTPVAFEKLRKALAMRCNVVLLPDGEEN